MVSLDKCSYPQIKLCSEDRNKTKSQPGNNILINQLPSPQAAIVEVQVRRPSRIFIQHS